MRLHAGEAAALCASRHIALFQCWSLYAVGELELGLGRPDAAIEQLDRLVTLLSGLGVVDVDLSPAPELVDALMRVVGITKPVQEQLTTRHERLPKVSAGAGAGRPGGGAGLSGRGD